MSTYRVENLHELGQVTPPILGNALTFKNTDIYSLKLWPPSLTKVGTVNPGVSLSSVGKVTNPFTGESYNGVLVGAAVRVIKGTSTIALDPPPSLTRTNVETIKATSVRSGPSSDFGVVMTLPIGSVAVASSESNGYFRLEKGQWAETTAFKVASGPPGTKPKSPFNWTYIIIAGSITFALASALGVRSMIKTKKAKKAKGLPK
jgi:hypothetical protein